MKTRTLLVTVALALGACSTESRVRVALYDQTPRAGVQRIDVFQPGETPPKPFTRIALLTVEGSAQEEGSCVDGLIRRARGLGADAIVLLEPEAPAAGLLFRRGLVGPSPSDRVFRGNAVVYSSTAR